MGSPLHQTHGDLLTTRSCRGPSSSIPVLTLNLPGRRSTVVNLSPASTRPYKTAAIPTCPDLRGPHSISTAPRHHQLAGHIQCLKLLPTGRKRASRPRHDKCKDHPRLTTKLTKGQCRMIHGGRLARDRHQVATLPDSPILDMGPTHVPLSG